MFFKKNNSDSVLDLTKKDNSDSILKIIFNKPNILKIFLFILTFIFLYMGSSNIFMIIFPGSIGSVDDWGEFTPIGQSVAILLAFLASWYIFNFYYKYTEIRNMFKDIVLLLNNYDSQEIGVLDKLDFRKIYENREYRKIEKYKETLLRDYGIYYNRSKIYKAAESIINNFEDSTYYKYLKRLDEIFESNIASIDKNKHKEEIEQIKDRLYNKFLNKCDKKEYLYISKDDGIVGELYKKTLNEFYKGFKNYKEQPVIYKEKYLKYHLELKNKKS